MTAIARWRPPSETAYFHLALAIARSGGRFVHPYILSITQIKNTVKRKFEKNSIFPSNFPKFSM
jgi:hypothetical protein